VQPLEVEVCHMLSLEEVLSFGVGALADDDVAGRRLAA